MDKIYIVMGTTGEYSDRQEWLVKAFRKRDSAETLVANASAEARRIESIRESRFGALGDGESNPFDPGMLMDYTGTSYSVWEVEIEE